MRRREKSSYVSDSDPPGCAQIDGLLGAEEAVRLRFIKDEQEQGDMKKISSKKGESPAQLIDARIEELDDWRGEMLARLRALIKQADPEVVEEWKWRGVPVWSHDGLICTGETYKTVVKLTFAKGASLKDPSGLFNSSLDGNVRRAIDIHEGEAVDEDAFRALIRAAVRLNESSARAPKKRRNNA